MMPSDSRSEPFGQYAEWYDAFNRNKDYAAEVRYILEHVREWLPSITAWLDVGCGTAGHVVFLKSAGLDVEGLDSSPSMIAAARAAHPDLRLHVGSAQNFRLDRTYDVVSMLFHAISYQTTDALLRGAIQNISAHLAPGGVFVFDCWNTDGVLREPPGPRVRDAEVNGRRLVRITQPTEDRERSLIDVGFEFRWDTPTGALAHGESHLMRHFTPRQLTDELAAAGLAVVSSYAWMAERPLGPTDWYGFYCARKQPGADSRKP